MSFQNGSASNPTDLLQQMATWLVGLGWTQDRNAVEGSGWTFSGHKGSNYIHLRSVMNDTNPFQAGNTGTCYALCGYLATGFNGSNPWNAQTGGPVGGSGQPVGVAMHLSAGPFANYHFFADSGGDNIVIVVEKTAGVFTHMGWGPSLQKAGSYTGGAYFFGSSSGFHVSATVSGSFAGYTTTADCPFPQSDALNSCTGFVRADVDSFTGKWISIWGGGSSGSANDQGYQGKQGLSSTPTTGDSPARDSVPCDKQFSGPQSNDLSSCTTSALDGRANLLPLRLFAQRDGSSTGFSLLGVPPFIFFTNAVGAGYSSATDYSLGGTTYRLFPNFAIVKQ